jgi:hypothetical protein
MPSKKKGSRRKPDHRFIAKHDRDVKWEEGVANALLTLPKGLKMKVFAYDPVMKRLDMKLRFPKGYVEPVHTHKSWHSILVTKGRMCVAGKDLRPGDYVFGCNMPHGPYEYPDGCEVFVVFMGEGTEHVWDEDKFLRHRTAWKAKTAVGKKAVARGTAARKRMLQKKTAEKRVSAKKSPPQKTAKKKTAKRPPPRR